MLSSCTSFKEIRKKDFPKQASSFAIVSFAEYGLEGRGLKTGFFKNENAEFVELGPVLNLNRSVEDELKKTLKMNGFNTVDVGYDRGFFREKIGASLIGLVNDINKNAKQLPDYYLVLIPLGTSKYYIKPKDNFNELDPNPFLIGASAALALINPAPLIVFSSIAVDHQIKKYTDLDLKEEPFYGDEESQNGLNFKIESLHKGKSSCNVAFELIAISREQKRIVGFAKQRFSGALLENYDWGRFNSFENFNQEEKNRIKKECVEVFNRGLIAGVKAVGL